MRSSPFNRVPATAAPLVERSCVLTLLHCGMGSYRFDSRRRGLIRPTTALAKWWASALTSTTHVTFRWLHAPGVVEPPETPGQPMVDSGSQQHNAESTLALWPHQKHADSVLSSIDHPIKNPERHSSLRAKVLSRSVDRIKHYWQETRPDANTCSCVRASGELNGNWPFLPAVALM